MSAQRYVPDSTWVARTGERRLRIVGEKSDGRLVVERLWPEHLRGTLTEVGAGAIEAVYQPELRAPAEQRREADEWLAGKVGQGGFAVRHAPASGKWPCQTEVPGGAALDRALPPRLAPFLYLLLRDGAVRTAEVEQLAIAADDPDAFENPHLESYARSLAVYLLHRPYEARVEEGPTSVPIRTSAAQAAFHRKLEPYAAGSPERLLCRRCDVYVGFGAAAVVHEPRGKTLDWLRAHCWVCGRSAREIREENENENENDSEAEGSR